MLSLHAAAAMWCLMQEKTIQLPNQDGRTCSPVPGLSGRSGSGMKLNRTEKRSAYWNWIGFFSSLILLCLVHYSGVRTCPGPDPEQLMTLNWLVRDALNPSFSLLHSIFPTLIRRDLWLLPDECTVIPATYFNLFNHYKSFPILADLFVKGHNLYIIYKASSRAWCCGSVRAGLRCRISGASMLTALKLW